MLSEASTRNRKASITRLDILPKLLEEQTSPTQSSTNHATVFDEGPTDHVQSLTEPSLPAHVHIRESRSNIAAYLDFAPPLCYSPTTTSGTALTSTAVSRKTSADDLIIAHSSLDVAALERFPRRICSAFFVYFLCGWGDGVTGTVLPKFQEELGMSYTESSLLFVVGTAGFFLGTLMIETVLRFMGRFDFSSQKRCCIPQFRISWCLFRSHFNVTNPTLGYSPTQARATILVLASVIHALFFVIMGSGAQFASMLVAFALAAFARAFLTGALNAYVNSLPKISLGQLHGFWALGAFFSPLVCQSLMSSGVPWRSFYLGSLVLSALNTTFLIFAYRPTPSEFSNDRIQASRAAANAVSSCALAGLPSPLGSQGSKLPSTIHPQNTLRQALTNPLVWAFAVFQGFYSGSETTTQGFAVLYLLGARAANPSTVGYVASGFWAGMAISRIGVGFLYPRMSFRSVKRLLHLNLFIALVMHVLVWVVPSLVADAFCTSILGLVYGPMFPLGVALPTRLLPVEIHMSSMAIMSTFASMGNAVFPFTAGILSNDVSVKTYSYILVGQGVVLVILWGFLPSKGGE